MTRTPTRTAMAAGRGILLYFRLGWIYFLHAVFSALLLAKLVEDTDWNWFIVFVPLFVFDVASAVYWVIYLVTYVRLKADGELDDITDTLCIPNYDEDYNPKCFPRQSFSVVVLLLYFLGILMKLTAEVLLCLALNGTISFIAPGSVYSVLFFGAGLSLLYYSLKPSLELLSDLDCFDT